MAGKRIPIASHSISSYKTVGRHATPTPLVTIGNTFSRANPSSRSNLVEVSTCDSLTGLKKADKTLLARIIEKK